MTKSFVHKGLVIKGSGPELRIHKRYDFFKRPASNFLNTSAFVLFVAFFCTLASAVYGVYQYRFKKHGQ